MIDMLKKIFVLEELTKYEPSSRHSTSLKKKFSYFNLCSFSRSINISRPKSVELRDYEDLASIKLKIKMVVV